MKIKKSRQASAAPKAVAESLTSYFLGQGNFVAAGGPMGMQPVPAASGPSIYSEATGFSGLSVQSVGYAIGADDCEEDDEINECDFADIHIYVSRGSQKALRELPQSISGLSCRVHNIGKLHVKPQQASVTTNRGNLYERDACVACGSSCAPSGRDYSGTLGAIVKKQGDPQMFALSNNHVIADCNHAPVGQPILSPSGNDGRPGISAPREVCRHSEIVELRSGEPTLVSPCREDLAIAAIPNPDVISSWQGNDTDGFDTPSSTIKPTTGLRVKKFGRTTGLTFGTMESVQFRTSIPYQSEFFRSLVWFEGVWFVQSNDADAFALGGDSGSLIVTEDGKNSVGVLFAASNDGSIGVIIPIEQVERAFGGLSLVSGHNT